MKIEEVTQTYVDKITQIEETSLDASISGIKEKEAKLKLDAAEAHSRKVIDVRFPTPNFVPKFL